MRVYQKIGWMSAPLNLNPVAVKAALESGKELEIYDIPFEVGMKRLQEIAAKASKEVVDRHNADYDRAEGKRSGEVHRYDDKKVGQIHGQFQKK
jgi:hypothetical protein